MLARLDRASALQAALVPFQVPRAEDAMALKPPLMLIKVLLCRDDSFL
jgi:hypothetical protein